MSEESTTPEGAPAPASEEVVGTPLPMPEENDWSNESVIVEPGAVTESGEVVEKEGEPEEEPEAEEVEEKGTPAPEPVVVEPVTPDPGAFEPSDYSFEVTVYDAEGKNGKTVKITSVEQWDTLLDQETNLGSPAAVAKALRLAGKMETETAREKREWEAKKEAHDKEETEIKARDEALNTMASEITYLEGKGLLPPVAKGFENSDWSDPEVAKQPGIKERVALLNYMRDENEARAKAGLKPMTSVVDAYNAYRLEENHQQEEETKVKIAQRRKDAGARVAKSSPQPVSVVPKGIMVGRGGNLRDLSGNNW